jgi:hypothetical protein
MIRMERAERMVSWTDVSAAAVDVSPFFEPTLTRV